MLGMQAVTRHILTIGQELTFAKERVALLDEAPRSSGPGTPQPVRRLGFSRTCNAKLEHAVPSSVPLLAP